MPVESGLAADVKALQAALEEPQARMQFEGRVGPSEDATS
jgi:hypothetical protein